jgi:DNA topoisomerase-1
MGMADKKVMVVLESPGKIKKVQSFLGSMYIVKASIGHILSLQKKDVLIENGFEQNMLFRR